MAIVDISKELLQHIKTSVQAGYPYETCGLSGVISGFGNAGFGSINGYKSLCACRAPSIQ
jgi:hypothetical protein